MVERDDKARGGATCMSEEVNISLRMDKTEERRRHGGANRISLGGAQQGFKYSRCERAKRKRERDRKALERERVRDRV